MNAKYAVALLLALQVSMSLCDHTPSPELVQKYEDMKATFYKRLVKLNPILLSVPAGFLESLNGTDKAEEFLTGLQESPSFQASAKIAGGVAEEVIPLVEKARNTVLGVYEQHLRPKVGETLNDAIATIKKFLDVYMPAE